MIRVTYTFNGFHKDYITNPIGTGLYNSIEDYRAEVLKYFPNATVVKTQEIEEVDFV